MASKTGRKVIMFGFADNNTDAGCFTEQDCWIIRMSAIESKEVYAKAKAAIQKDSTRSFAEANYAKKIKRFDEIITKCDEIITDAVKARNKVNNK